MKLEFKTFKTVVASTPLVSIDLIVKNKNNQVLLGERVNRPAQTYWFVPGGRILKDESFEKAFSRLTTVELGKEYSLYKARFLGPYQHFYEDNFSGREFSTHYVVLGYEVLIDIDINDLPEEQHGAYRWWDVKELLDSNKVHKHTKDYFL